jgi:uncharacterized protein (DUF1015 family)
VAQIRPFAGIHYARHPELDLSRLIAPPYDVLDERGKSALQAAHPNNVVTIDLPHLPPKSVGPDSTYERANVTLRSWLKAGILHRDARPAFYPYAQTFDHAGRTHHRRGFIAAVRLSPFGAGHVVPHEKTYSAPIEDRLKLMRATRVQLSPIFGLFSDPKNEVTNMLYQRLGRPEWSGTLEGVKNDLWRVTDADVENAVVDWIGHKPIYIADGHHRYTTALQYQAEAEKAHGSPLPPNHPANFCMFVLVGMQDDGLLILPTHRLIGGISSFNIEDFRQALGADWEVTETNVSADRLAEFADTALMNQPLHAFGLFDGRSRKLYQLRLKNLDILKPLEPNHSDAWRRLDVAILQRYLLDEVIAPRFKEERDVTRGYTADPADIAPQVDGVRYQIALLLRPTPLGALQQLGEHGEVMPQKSTYFFPKVATGMVMNPLE